MTDREAMQLLEERKAHEATRQRLANAEAMVLVEREAAILTAERGATISKRASRLEGALREALAYIRECHHRGLVPTVDGDGFREAEAELGNGGPEGSAA